MGMNLKTGVAVILCLVVSFIMVLPLTGQDVSDLIEKGKEAYEKGNYREAEDIFTKVIGEIQRHLSKSLEAFIPEAPDGWTAGEIESESASYTSQGSSMRQNSATCRYTSNSDQLQVTVNITNIPQMIEGYRQMVKMLKNNTMMKMAFKQSGEPPPEIEEKDGWDVVIEKNEDEVDLIALHQDVMVNINGPAEEIARKFLSGIDLKGLAEEVSN